MSENNRYINRSLEDDKQIYEKKINKKQVTNNIY